MDSYYELPFKVKQILMHNERFFAIDECGQLQWSEKGRIDRWYVTPTDVTYYGSKYNMPDAGWWGFVDEPIVRIEASEQGLIVITTEKRYLFTGDSYGEYKMETIRLTMEEIKGCPFCGGAGDIWEREDVLGLNGTVEFTNGVYHYAPIDAKVWVADCSECDCVIGENFKSREEAITAWNRRVPE